MTRTTNLTIETDEQTKLVCLVYYEFQGMAFRADRIANIEYKVIGQTETPDFVVYDQILDHLKMIHGQIEIL